MAGDEAGHEGEGETASGHCLTEKSRESQEQAGASVKDGPGSMRAPSERRSAPNPGRGFRPYGDDPSREDDASRTGPALFIRFSGEKGPVALRAVARP